MSWRDALAEIATAADEEFAEDVIHCPMIRLPNQRPIEDPKRPPYLIRAIFDKNKSGPQRVEAELTVHHKGRHGAVVPTLHPFLTIPAAYIQSPPVQGDEFLVVADSARYRALNVERSMQGMTRVMLEELGRVDPQ